MRGDRAAPRAFAVLDAATVGIGKAVMGCRKRPRR
jgi:hypothetical protein